MNSFFTLELEELDEWLDFMDRDIDNVRRVLEFIRQSDMDAEFMVHEKTETADESSEAMDIDPGKVVKTLVFMSGGDPVAVLAPGDREVDEGKLEQVTGGDLRIAEPGEVEEATGYVVGSVSPFDLDIPVYMEESLLKRSEVKPASGSRVVGVEVDPSELADAVDARTVDVA